MTVLERWQHVASVPAITNQWLRVSRNTYKTPTGVIDDYYILERNDFVLVIALDGESMILVRQYRPATDRFYLALPAGYVDRGESEASAARRELKEETGLDAVDMDYLGQLHPLPGYIRSIAHVFRCRVNNEQAANVLTERGTSETTELVRVERDAVRRMILTGEIVEMQAVAAILLSDLTESA